MASRGDSGASAKRQRRRGDPEEGREPSAAAEEKDLISSLLHDLRLQILRHLPLKSAIRTGALSTKWRGLWARRWPEPSSIRRRVSRRGAAEKLLESFRNRGVHSLNRFSLTFRWKDLSPADFQRCVDYAAACTVEDLHLHFVDPPHADIVAVQLLGGGGDSFVTFSFREASPLLARVSILGVTIDLPQDATARSFSALEIVSLRWVVLRHGSVRELVAACPRLHTLDLRDCTRLPLSESTTIYDVRPGARLRSLTVTRCEVADLLADTASDLCSFRYCGNFIGSSSILASAPLHDLCICFDGAMSSMSNLLGLSSTWLDALTNFSNLTVLTICSSTLPRPGSITYLSFEILRELQLVMFRMDQCYLAYIYEFFRTCYCPQLERLFVQFPCYKPFSFKLKMPFENEKVEEDMMSEELSEYDASKEELSRTAVLGEASMEEPSMGKVSEEETSVEVLLEAEAPEGDKLPGATVPEEASLDKLSGAKVSEEEAPEDNELSGATVPQEEASVNELLESKVSEAPEEDDISEEEALLEDNWPEEEGSEDDQLEEELLNNGIESLVLENDLKNLVLIKMLNFHGNKNEMKLVNSMLRKAARLNKLLLVAPKRHEHEFQKIPLDELHSLETELLLLEKASANVQIILRDSDDPATQSMHSEVITE
ncbi:hypothetical protein QOZ80_6BG0502240 [Eleusine coracana subsp. coracana]|nr:hypothetical protein QOZ80_6BG0502240 [Eleusine coracana subsp. coracana]